MTYGELPIPYRATNGVECIHSSLTKITDCKKKNPRTGLNDNMESSHNMLANKLLAAHGRGQVGQKWPANFVRRANSPKTRFNRAYDRQRALYEDPVLIRSWFKPVEERETKYGICDDDVYNFNEAGFMIGQDHDSARRNRRREEWVTVIQTINTATGLWRLMKKCHSGPPFTVA
jgi:hypothetical protein